jgi:hypothetical protein
MGKSTPRRSEFELLSQQQIYVHRLLCHSLVRLVSN